MRRALLSAALAPLLLLPAGCGPDSDPLSPQAVDLQCPGSAGGAVTLVVGARANSPRPVLPGPILGLIREAAKRGAPIQIVRLDGAPAVAVTSTFRPEAQNAAARSAELKGYLTAVVAAVDRVRARAPEADVLGALSDAARRTPLGGTVVVIDSGLQTTGLVRFQDAGTFAAEPAELVAYLREVDGLPKLDGLAVIFAGLGDTADPQPALDQRLRNRVIALWSAIAEAGGPQCLLSELVAPASRPPLLDDVPVTTVPLPAPPVFAACGRTVLDDASNVGFLPDKAEFRDAAAATTTLRSLADVVRRGRQHVTLTGTTASTGSSTTSGVTLSRRRAQAVALVLVSLGVPAGRITSIGGGSGSRFHLPDRDSAGKLIPAAAARNRSVVIELSCP